VLLILLANSEGVLCVVCVNQVTVTDAVGPSRFSCQLTSSRLALELLHSNMNDCYKSTSRRQSQQHDADADVEELNTSAGCLNSSRLSANLERPLGVHQGAVGEDVTETEEPVNDESPVDDDDDDVADMLLTVDQLQPGLCCAALFTDGCWYRARVKSVEGEVVQVVFIDYGTEAAVDVCDLRWLKERFTSAKMMSFQCSLEGWLEETGTDASEQFQQLVLNRKVIADVVTTTTDEDKSVKYVVRLLDMGLSVGDRLKNPDVYKAVTVCVTSATSPHDFWCRCIDDDGSTAELPLLMDRIADLYSDSDQPPESCEVDLDDEEMLYVARYTDGVWYRAKIISSHQSTTPATVDVLFVDYGTKTEVSACDLRPLPESCHKLPAQAIHCRLAGIEPTTGEAAVWDETSMSRFIELVMCTDDERSFQLLPVNVVQNADGDCVEYCGQLLDGGKDIGAELVASGYALDCSNVRSHGLSSVERRRHSSCLSEERCNLFISFDAGSDAVDEVDDTVADEAKADTAEKVADAVVASDDIHTVSDKDATAAHADNKKEDDRWVTAASHDVDDKATDEAADSDKMDEEFSEAVESLGKCLSVYGYYCYCLHDDCRRIQSTVWKLTKQTP